jgi:ABC-type transporter Mla MlaB component
MLRITWVGKVDAAPVLRLEGELLEPWLEEVRRASAAPPAGAQLDLAALTYVDRAGLQLLRQLCAGPWHVATCSRFVAELLQKPDGLEPVRRGGQTP